VFKQKKIQGQRSVWLNDVHFIFEILTRNV
jgi:hypothetical protein